MLNFNLFENINLNCFCKSKTKDEWETDGDLNSSLYKVARDYQISIMPVDSSFELCNLYPELTNHVEQWNTLVVGKDKTSCTPVVLVVVDGHG